MSVNFGGHIYLFELKVVEKLTDGTIQVHINHKGYADRYRASGQTHPPDRLGVSQRLTSDWGV
ncbi:hypothetical protein [Vreelandella sulfidaeris]|uniref:hypothetical protein n=1 Tax=Vreelandella sulfidaeris TaxID=115553 RepID=UPI0011BE5F36|nr:hypothetical protein [Halomonas sulfidaeris]